MTLGHHALLAGQDASMYLGRQAHHVAVQSLPLIADAADGARHLATEAVSTSFGKFRNCLQREDTSSSLASDDEPVAELPLSAKLAMEQWTQPQGALQRALSLGSQHSHDVAPVTLQQPAIRTVSRGTSLSFDQ